MFIRVGPDRAVNINNITDGEVTNRNEEGRPINLVLVTVDGRRLMVSGDYAAEAWAIIMDLPIPDPEGPTEITDKWPTGNEIDYSETIGQYHERMGWPLPTDADPNDPVWGNFTVYKRYKGKNEKNNETQATDRPG